MNQNESIIKVAFLGNSQVGKTCLIHSITGNFQYNVTPTLRPEKFEHKIKIDHINYNITLWDLPGKDKELKNSKSNIRSCNILYLVFDLTNRNSFEDLEKYWIKNVEDYKSNESLIYLLGNKSDIFEQSEINHIQAQNLATRKKYKFQIISAKEESNIKIIENAIREYNTNFGMQDNNGLNLEKKEDFDSNRINKSNSTWFGGNKKTINTTESNDNSIEKEKYTSKNENIHNQSLNINNSDNKEEQSQSLISETGPGEERKKLLNIINLIKFSEYLKVVSLILTLVLLSVLIIYSIKTEDLLNLYDFNSVNLNIFSIIYDIGCKDSSSRHFDCHSCYDDDPYYPYNIHCVMYLNHFREFRIRDLMLATKILIIFYGILCLPSCLFFFFRKIKIKTEIIYSTITMLYWIIFMILFLIFSKKYALNALVDCFKFYKYCEKYFMKDINKYYELYTSIILIIIIGFIIIPIRVIPEIIYLKKKKTE